MKYSILILVGIVSIVLDACGGGGSNGSIPTNNTPALNGLLPLNISMHDLNNNRIPYIDVYKIESVVEYKLTFTNPNSVAVTRPMSGGSNSGYYITIDLNWEHAKDKTEQPGNGEMSGAYFKTSNPDDCFNIISLTPGASCSFYTLASNSNSLYANYTNQNEFSYPISYVISEIANPKNILEVEQCQRSSDTTYDCNNETKPGFTNQFITYRMVPLTTINNSGISLSWHPNDGNYYYTAISNDGNWYYRCGSTTAAGGVCIKEQVNYNSAINTLFASNQTNFNYSASLAGVVNLYPLIDGSSIWIIGVNLNSYNYEAFNSSKLDNGKWYGIGAVAGNIVKGISGFDGSFWVNVDDGLPRLIYDSTTDHFARSNIQNFIYAVDKEGAVITEDEAHNLLCARTTGSYTQYATISMQDFILPTNFSSNTNQREITVGNKFYAYMDNMVLYNSFGESYNVGAYYRIKTDNGACEIDSNDFILSNNASVYPNYSLIGESITSTANIAGGY